ncbi:DHH family phosphoesterase [Bacillus fonticola]|uniref:DHH family phosphoesterase n=1 Tax=Bacillus fonticola TaxID=2728853 RepID=UPI0014741F54|nr:bifunctional oligoribonuclease/PAP phosphatase NrnA [Bacillus fonticola]
MREAILQEIEAYDTIIIHRHVRPDPDAYGSQGGLAELIAYNYPDKSVYTVGEEDSTLRFLREMDHIPDGLYEGALVIVTDTANTERVCDNRYDRGARLVKIDHHPNEDPYGDVLWVDTTASSASEMIVDLYHYGKQKKGWKLNEEAARLLYGGIVGDTGRFLYPSTTEKTFQFAGELIQFPFSRTELYDGMYKIPLKLARLQGYVLQHISYSAEGAAQVRIPMSLLEEFEVDAKEASQLVSMLGSIEGILCWVFFIEEEDQIRVRFRSKGPVINVLAKKYRGGGHPLAAGASIHTWEEADDVYDELEKVAASHAVQ